MQREGTGALVGAATDSFPIGPLQEGLWVFWKLNPDSAAYNMPEVIHVDGPFDLAAAQLAFDQTRQRHDALRTRFRETEAGVVQVVSREPDDLPVEVVDLRDVPAAERADRFAAVVHARANAPFDLAALPPFRLTAIRTEDARTSLVLALHHIVCDGRSMSRLLEDFEALHEAARHGVAAELPAAPPGYPELVRSQLDALSGENLREELDYWRSRLAGARGSVLPGDGDSSGGDGGDGGGDQREGAHQTCTVSTALEPALAAAVVEYARGVRATPYAILLTTMQVMLAVASGRDEVVLGTVTEGRSRRFAGTVGMVANTLVIRSGTDTTRSFAALLGEVSFDLMDALDHQDLPYSRVIGELDGAGTRLGDDLIRTIFTGGAGRGETARDDKSFGIPAYRVEGPFRLIALAYVDASAIALDWEFALRSYSRETAVGYTEAYREFLAALLGSPESPINSLGLTEVLARRVPRAYPVADDGAEPTSAEAESRGPDQPSDGAPTDTEDRVLSPVEAAVAEIWAEFLDVPVGSPSDDFFQLGGHSMVASQVIAVVRRKVAPVTMRKLFDHPQLRDFCAQLSPAG